MSFDFEGARRAAAELNKTLTPIAKRPIDLNDPEWKDKALAKPKPLDEANVRTEAEALVDSLLEAYAHGDDALRSSIRMLFADNPMLAWAADISEPWTTPGGLRKRLLLISAINGGEDIRDAIVGAEELSLRAQCAGVDVAPILTEVEQLSSDAVIHGMMSLQEVMRRARQSCSLWGRVKSESLRVAFGLRRKVLRASRRRRK